MQARIDTNGMLVADKSESRTEIEQGCRDGGPEVRCGDWCPLFAIVEKKAKQQVHISCGGTVVKYDLV